MQYQFGITPATDTSAPPPLPDTVPELLKMMLNQQSDLLTQILEVQRENLNLQRAAVHDSVARWRHVLGRWEQDHPEFGEHSKIAYPLMERAYIHLLASMLEEIAEKDDDALENEFAVQEFLDRYGMKIGQLSHLLSIVGPMSEAAQQNEAAKQQQTPPS